MTGEQRKSLIMGPFSHTVTTQRHPLGIVSLGFRRKLFTTKGSFFLLILTGMALSELLESHLFPVPSSSLKFISQYLWSFLRKTLELGKRAIAWVIKEYSLIIWLLKNSKFVFIKQTLLSAYHIGVTMLSSFYEYFHWIPSKTLTGRLYSYILFIDKTGAWFQLNPISSWTS